MLCPILIVAFYFGNLIRCLICVHVFMFSHSAIRWGFWSCCAPPSKHWFRTLNSTHTMRSRRSYTTMMYAQNKWKFLFDVNKCFMLSSDSLPLHSQCALFSLLQPLNFVAIHHSTWGFLCFVCVYLSCRWRRSVSFRSYRPFHGS